MFWRTAQRLANLKDREHAKSKPDMSIATNDTLDQLNQLKEECRRVKLQKVDVNVYHDEIKFLKERCTILENSCKKLAVNCAVLSKDVNTCLAALNTVAEAYVTLQNSYVSLAMNNQSLEAKINTWAYPGLGPIPPQLRLAHPFVQPPPQVFPATVVVPPPGGAVSTQVNQRNSVPNKKTKRPRDEQ
jgi:hypothetical protein